MIARALLLTFCLFLGGAQAGEAPRVVVSIAPLHSLVAGVMEGVAEPELLVDGASSPHNYSLRPSQVRRLQAADMVIWLGPEVEGFLPKVLRSLDGDTRMLELLHDGGLDLLDAREGGAWAAGHEEHDEDHDHHDHEGIDGHVWLDPMNAGRIVQVTAEHLSAQDPANATIYSENAAQLMDRIARLERAMDKRLAIIRNQPFLVFHDAYQYLERRFQLNAVGALTVDPERRPGAKRLSELRKYIEKGGVRCMFTEPQFSDSVSKALVGEKIRIATLDPMGADLHAGTELYFQLMEQMSTSLSHCLSK